MPQGTPTFHATSSGQTILLQALRCWAVARNLGLPGQPTLARSLFRLRSAILVPTLDSLMTFYELALGRHIRIGDAPDPTVDEAILLMMVEGRRDRKTSLDCGEVAGFQLDRAIRSTQVMLRLASTMTARRWLFVKAPIALKSVIRRECYASQ